MYIDKSILILKFYEFIKIIEKIAGNTVVSELKFSYKTSVEMINGFIKYS
jgi:hypothetical protein